MNITTLNVLGIKKDLVALGPQASYSVDFFPSNGLLRICGNKIGAHPFVADTINEPPTSNNGRFEVSAIHDTIDLVSVATSTGTTDDAEVVRPELFPRISVSGAVGISRDPLSTSQPSLPNPPRSTFMLRRPFDNGSASVGDDLVIGPTFPLEPPIPPIFIEKIEAEIFREGHNVPFLTKDQMNGFRNRDSDSFRLVISDVPLRRLGNAPEKWTVKFTNISDQNISFNPRILYSKKIRVESTDISLAFLNTPVNQMINTLDLNIKIDGNNFTIGMNDEVLKKNIPFLPSQQPIPGVPDTSLIGFHDISSTLVDFSVDSIARAGEPGLFPTIVAKIEFEENGHEINIKYLPDLNLTGLSLDLEVSMSSVVHDDRITFDHFYKKNHVLIGDFDRTPKLNLEILAKTELEFTKGSKKIIRIVTFTVAFVAGTLIAGPIVGLVVGLFADETLDDFIDGFEKTINDALKKFLVANQSTLSKYFEIGFEKLVNKDLEFFGIHADANSWEVLLGPSVEEFQSPTPAMLGLGTSNITEPVDGPQLDSDLDNLNNIDHIVFLMLENRSYDHILGHLSLPAYGNNNSYEGLTGRERNAIKNLTPDAWPNPMPNINYAPGPNHGHDQVMEQISDGHMSGFANQHRNQIANSSRPFFDARTIMNFHTPSQLPTYDKLVEEFTVATRWFSSFPGGTWPNRFCAITGSTPILRNEDLKRDDFGYIEELTIFDLLNEGNVDWEFYEHDLTFLRFFNNYRLNENNILSFEDFPKNVVNGDLPSVMFIDPNFTHVPGGGVPNDDHPSLASTSMLNGQNLVASVVNGLKASNNWDSTLLVVTYDEHGGFYDHMAPPGSGQSEFSNVAKVHPLAPSMMGVRVPAFIVSPWAERGGAINRVFDHTSILKTILARFLPEKQGSLGARVAQAAHLGGALTREAPRIFARDLKIAPVRNESRKEVLDEGDFHSHINSMASPIHLSEERIRRKFFDS